MNQAPIIPCTSIRRWPVCTLQLIDAAAAVYVHKYHGSSSSSPNFYSRCPTIHQYTRYVPGERTGDSVQKELALRVQAEAPGHQYPRMHQHHVPCEHYCTSILVCHALSSRSSRERSIPRVAHHLITARTNRSVLDVWENRAATAVRRAPWTDQPRPARPSININETGS